MFNFLYSHCYEQGHMGCAGYGTVKYKTTANPLYGSIESRTNISQKSCAGANSLS